VNTARIRPTDAMVATAGLVLLVSLFLRWYEFSGGGATAFESFGVLDKLLLVVAVLALLTPIVTAVKDTPSWPVAVLDLLVAFAFLALLFTVFRLVDTPGRGDVDLAAGAWLGLAALLATFVAGAVALRDERAPAIPEPAEIPVMPAPPREAAGSGPAASSS
jgi:hypothetical protein